MEHQPDLVILSVTTTVGSAEDARRLARELVSCRIAACVQVESGLTSFYRWNGQPCEDAEVRLTIKTLPALAPVLRAFLAEHHPYDVPQFLASTLQASEAYAKWVAQEVGPPA